MFEIFKTMAYSQDFELEWQRLDRVKLKELLVGSYEFSENAVTKKLDQLEKLPRSQQSLGDFF